MQGNQDTFHVLGSFVNGLLIDANSQDYFVLLCPVHLPHLGQGGLTLYGEYTDSRLINSDWLPHCIMLCYDMLRLICTRLEGCPIIA